MSSAEVLVLRGTLEGHNGWVTSLATSPAQPNLLLSGSRDKSLITWKLTGDDQQYGVPVRSFRGHSHIVQDCTVTPDGEYALSASWDKTVRLWELASGKCIQRFVGHKSDVLSVTIDRRASQIVSASRDKTVKVWNTLGECMVTLLGHNDWVSQVRVAPNETPEDETVTVISAGMDKVVKVWNLHSFQIEADFIGHNNYVNTVTASPDGTLVASAGKDGQIMLWNLTEKEALYTLNAQDEVFAVAFSPNRYWLTAATSSGIKIFNLEERKVVDELKPEFAGYTKAAEPHAISLAWSADGQTLFAGYTDNVIRVWQVMTAN
ncbi:Guanine nucleotide-binding protein subunit beta-like protein [Lachancea thermotolerans]|uniref:Small ribosomal subunit protein RACK1 n=2 Tax=Lachancea TaxID=300275 RepID=C5DGD7_LACTC|nr:KLTH0D04466p [Lachancea thermotolerans CBS 6340]CAR22479.1 KLTH0D04466p [Lachancea thermotolerans CBS 6340]CUS20684.1 LAQU0S01e12266g1_1 [Lachancea quebecensis]